MSRLFIFTSVPSSPSGRSAQENARYSSLPISYLSCIKGVLPPLEWSVELRRSSFPFAHFPSLFPSQKQSLSSFSVSSRLKVPCFYSELTYKDPGTTFPLFCSFCIASWSTHHILFISSFPLSVFTLEDPITDLFGLVSITQALHFRLF